MNRIYIVRHGQSENHVSGMTGGWTDLPLTPLGLEQASKVAEHLARQIGKQVASLFSSDLQRAYMTATVIGRRLELGIVEDRGLRELNNGIAAGLSEEEAKIIELPRTEPGIDWIPYPEAETWRRMTDRVSECMSRLALESKATAIVVTHAGAATAIVKWWLRLEEPYKHSIDFEFRSCSITELAESEWRERVIVRLNDIAHL
ncbi:MAG: histidine phosphatase family protein [Acidobacteria bacterium]|nr:histidine phosphatase family protein [Acidobacteriota bacterium]